MNLLTTADVAAKYDVTPRRILAIAEDRGIAPARTLGRVHLWDRRQVVKLKPGKAGRPAAA